jgi:hypothetical protein
MKKVINGKSYNCDTAREIAYARSDCGKSDFAWWEETLYKKSTGEFFLEGHGGPMSRYSQASGANSTISGSAIVPLTLADTKAWIESKGDWNLWTSLFGQPPE